MVMGASQFFTTGWIMGRTMGARKAVPSKIARMVPLGLFHISFKLYSFTRAALGVMVAHLTATPYFLVALAESTVTWSLVSSLYSSPRS